MVSWARRYAVVGRVGAVRTSLDGVVGTDCLDAAGEVLAIQHNPLLRRISVYSTRHRRMQPQRLIDNPIKVIAVLQRRDIELVRRPIFDAFLPELGADLLRDRRRLRQVVEGVHECRGRGV